jgi:putative lipase involved disintegration of autophagic bodies
LDVIQGKPRVENDGAQEITHQRTWKTADELSGSKFKSVSYQVYQHDKDLTIIAIHAESINDYRHAQYTWLAEEDNISSHIEKYWQESLSTLSTIVSEALKENHQIIFTGHSLGGFLAQLFTTNLLLQSLTEERDSIRAVVFDSPGIEPQASKLFTFYRAFIN